MWSAPKVPRRLFSNEPCPAVVSRLRQQIRCREQLAETQINQTHPLVGIGEACHLRVTHMAPFGWTLVQVAGTVPSWRLSIQDQDL